MVNIIENWAIINGTIKNVSDNPKLRGFTTLKVLLEKSTDVSPYPNLAKADEGSLISINIRTTNSDKEKLLPGMEFNGTVRKSIGQIYFSK